MLNGVDLEIADAPKRIWLNGNRYPGTVFDEAGWSKGVGCIVSIVVAMILEMPC